MKRFFFWCAGCVPELIRECPSEHPKYVSLGGAVFATWLLASISGGYAASVIFAGSPYAIAITVAVALVWGWMLFNIDRAVITSMHKVEAGSTWERLRAELLPAIPRLALAGVLAFTIADPLKVRLTTPDLGGVLAEQRDTRVAERARTLRASHASRLAEIAAQDQALRTEIASLDDELKALQQQYFAEMDGSGGSRRYGFSVVAQQKKAVYDAAARTTADARTGLRTRLDALLSERTRIEDQERSTLAAYRASLGQGYFSLRSAMATLAGREPAVWWGMFAISALILIVEITPVLVKLLSRYGPYDARKAAADAVGFFAARRYRETQETVVDRRQALEADSGRRLAELDDEASFPARAAQVEEAWRRFGEQYKHGEHQSVDALRADLRKRVLTTQG